MAWKRKKEDSPPHTTESEPEVSGSGQESQPEELQVQQTDVIPQVGVRPAVFEFGGPVKVGDLHMLGNCTASDPDEIQACVWRVEKVPDAHESKPRAKYHIEF
ncbi:hypothetical protein WJX72_007751 [[Myrmecia] bisecta]|uniref:Uncharacterized protein n=1 Tax=[Myrmecia] bisecta TaxID=41462 RepID=A0AAW1QG47_9CHLO